MNLELRNQSTLYQSQWILLQYSPTLAWPEKYPSYSTGTNKMAVTSYNYV